MEIMGRTYTEKEKAGKALIEVCQTVSGTAPVKIGTHRGFSLLVSFDTYSQSYRATLKGALQHQTTLGTDIHGNITRLNNVLADLPKNLELSRQSLENSRRQLETAKGELEKPFPMEAELAAKSERLAQLDAELNMDNGHPQSKPESIEPDEPVSETAHTTDGLSVAERNYSGHKNFSVSF
jgi:hypothetical protein